MEAERDRMYAGKYRLDHRKCKKAHYGITDGRQYKKSQSLLLCEKRENHGTEDQGTDCFKIINCGNIRNRKDFL